MQIDSYSENEFKVVRSMDFVFSGNKRNFFHLYYEDESEQLRALRQIASYYKEKNPNEWILVTDYAREPKGKIKTNKNEVILELMELLCKNKFEKKIFMLKYEGNQMRFFWEKIDSMCGKSLMQ
jgi:adenylate cyclase